MALTPHLLLGLLERAPSHGYTLKQAFDEHFGRGRELRTGQVYSTLQRFERDGWAGPAGQEPGSGPERRLYAITADGVSELTTWLTTPEPATSGEPNALVTRITLALMSDRPAEPLLDAQRAVHLARMRELTTARRTSPVTEQLALDHEIAHLDADLKWIDTAVARLDVWRTELGGAR